jgi:hypothetical protein
MEATAFNLDGLASRHLECLDALEEKHLDWTLETEMDEETLPSNKPNVLSPFLPSQVATINTLLQFIPELDSDDCIIDLG